MNDKKHVNFIKSIINAIKFNRLSGANGTSLRLRLFAFFAAFTLFILTAFFLMLMGFGVTLNGSDRLKESMDSTLTLMSDQIYRELNALTIQGISMSDKLSNDIDKYLHENNLYAELLQDHPEHIEPLLSSQAPYLLNTLEYTGCSGAFIMLDATVNPDLTNAEHSKSGLFIMRTTPNAIGNKGSKLHYLRGPASIAREHDIELLGQWKMEYDTTNQDFWFDTMDTARTNPTMDLSRLYYFTDKVVLKDSADSCMLLIIPLRSEEGYVYGVCGLQFSSMYFKYQYSPDNTKYSTIFSALAPVTYTGGDIDAGLEAGLIAGNSYLTGMSIDTNASVHQSEDGFSVFDCDDGSGYIGIYQTIRLYPSDSPYSNTDPALCLLMSEDEFDSVISGNSVYLYIFIIILLIISLLLSLFISNRYIRPLTDAFENIKEQNYNYLKNKYFEINDLMEFLAQKDNERLAEQTVALASDIKLVQTDHQSVRKLYPDTEQTASRHSELQTVQGDQTLFGEENSQSMLDDFISNINLLSNAEKAVFNLYLEGYRAAQIAELLCLSINTIKSHNRRIFAKLNVSSRNELMVYVNLMREKDNLEKCENHVKEIR